MATLENAVGVDKNIKSKGSKSKKATKSDAFVWTDDEVELLLSVVLDYKTTRTAENVDWETCQQKYTDILDLFVGQYPSPENTIQMGKETVNHCKPSVSLFRTHGADSYT